jgi:hypothetical protein
MLGRIAYGPALVEAFPQATTQFFVQSLNAATRSRAWFWDVRQDEQRFRDLMELREQRHRRPAGVSYSWLILSPATPVKQVRGDPALDADGPGAFVVSALAYPGWHARLIHSEETKNTDTDGSESGCRVVQVPAGGRYRVELKFRSRSFELGRTISFSALLVWIGVMQATLPWRRRVRTRPNPAS